jgi:hypothetical protein
MATRVFSGADTRDGGRRKVGLLALAATAKAAGAKNPCSHEQGHGIISVRAGILFQV